MTAEPPAATDTAALREAIESTLARRWRMDVETWQITDAILALPEVAALIAERDDLARKVQAVRGVLAETQEQEWNGTTHNSLLYRALGEPT